jgi:NAD(P)-dependent dehydrogenase (short-subunit alcohol dehydrogenase family)
VASDITDPHSAEALVAACVASFGGLHVAFNNAGIVGHVRPPVADADADVEVFDRVIATNVRGTWLSIEVRGARDPRPRGRRHHQP